MSEPRFPDAIKHALDAYRDRCWRGGDPTPERMCVEREIENHVAAMVNAALDKAIPPALPDDEVRDFLESCAADAEKQAREYEGFIITDPAVQRQAQEGWAAHARVFRTVIERLYRGVSHAA